MKPNLFLHFQKQDDHIPLLGILLLLYLMIYLAGINAFTGLVEVLRSREEKSVGSPGWKYRAAYGGASLLIAVAVIVGCTRLHSIRLVVYVYAAGLVYKSLVRIASAFRRTAIVFVQ